MLLIVCFLTILFGSGNCVLSEVHPLIQQTYANVLNYHKSVHLFYQDWINDAYGKANLTVKEKQYYDSLLPGEQIKQSPMGEIYAIVHALSEDHPTENILNSIMVLFRDFHNDLFGCLETQVRDLDLEENAGNAASAQSGSGSINRRRRRQVDDTMAKLLDLMRQLGNLQHLSPAERRLVRRPIRKAILDMGRRIWRKFLRIRRQNRQARLNNNGSPSPGDNGPIVAPPPSPGDIAAPPPAPGVIAAPPPPKTTLKFPDENIPTQDPNKEDELLVGKKNLAPPPPSNNKPVAPPPPSGNPPQAPPSPNAPLAGPPPVNTNSPQAPPIPLRTEATPSENIPTANPNDIFRRKRRSIEDNDEGREEYFSLSQDKRDKFEAALKWMMTEKPEGNLGLSNYEVFVRKHRMTEYSEAYSKEDNFAFHSQFLSRFENALQQFNADVQLPYIDICHLMLKPPQERLYQIQSIFAKVNNKVIPECSWIGGDIKRSIYISSISLKKLDEVFNCSNSEVRQRSSSFGMEEYAALHSIFGPCVTGGSHMACPTCAVSDPIFWMLYANIERILPQETL